MNRNRRSLASVVRQPLAAALFMIGLGAQPLHSLAAPSQTSSARLAMHKLQPMDLVKVQFFQEPDLDRELRVSQDHKLVLPLVGSVDVANRTVREVELMIIEMYGRDYLVNPQVNITVMEYAQRTVTVLGAVNNPGPVVIPPERNLTFLDAIARSGGFSRLANRKSVSLTRNLPDGQTANYTINADEMVSGDAGNRWTLRDGDIISVPERLL